MRNAEQGYWRIHECRPYSVAAGKPAASSAKPVEAPKAAPVQPRVPAVAASKAQPVKKVAAKKVSGKLKTKAQGTSGTPVQSAPLPDAIAAVAAPKKKVAAKKVAAKKTAAKKTAVAVATPTAEIPAKKTAAKKAAVRKRSKKAAVADAVEESMELFQSIRERYELMEAGKGSIVRKPKFGGKRSSNKSTIHRAGGTVGRKDLSGMQPSERSRKLGVTHGLKRARTVGRVTR
jgi:hypothetical protein